MGEFIEEQEEGLDWVLVIRTNQRRAQGSHGPLDMGVVARGKHTNPKGQRSYSEKLLEEILNLLVFLVHMEMSGGTH